jgi:hypothetical protein
MVNFGKGEPGSLLPQVECPVHLVADLSTVHVPGLGSFPQAIIKMNTNNFEKKPLLFETFRLFISFLLFQIK